MLTQLPGTKTFHFTRQFIVFSLTAVCVYLLWIGAQTVTAASFHPPHAQASTIYYVKTAATGTGDGSSWANATTLYGALGGATDGDEIWVAGGTYLPGTLRTDSFNLKPGVAVYGGFAGDELNQDERDWAANPTILSGDIGIPNDDNDNSYHVIIADGTTGTPITESTILDGFTITAGRAYSPFPHDRGGGFYCLGDGSNNACSPSLTHIIFLDNGAAYGGAMFNYGNSSPTLTNVIFLDNSSGFGAGMFNYGANGGTCTPQLTNVTFSQNRGVTGGAMYNYGLNNTTSPALTNVILWGNSEYGEEIFNEDASLTISYSVVEGGLGGIINSGNSSVIDGGNNLVSNPLFVDPPNNDLRLQADSPVIDNGNNNAPGLSGITTDIDGHVRVVDGDGDGIVIVDLGAYEYQSTCPTTTTLFVNHSATGDASGDDWLNAQPDLATALVDAENCNVNEIWVAAGTYLPGSERTDSFNLLSGVGVYGGFVGNETMLEERDWFANPTFLSGDIGTPGDNSDNSYHVVYAEGAAGTVITSTTILDGFTIMGGHANGLPENNQGGGFYCNGIGSGSECSPSLTNLTFIGNTASYWGGAIYNRGDSGVSSPSLTNINFYNNKADRGGAIYNYGAHGISSPSLTNISFSGNTATSGGAIYNYGYNGNSSPILTNAILWGDSLPEIYNDDASPTISNSLLLGGIAGVFNSGNSTVTDGGSNLESAPLFVDASIGDLRLHGGSPAIDMGDNNTPGLNGVTVDLAVNPRIVDGNNDDIATVDMGAYEFQAICPATSTLFVFQQAMGNDSGDDWVNAQPDLTIALGQAASCDVDEVWVATGTYLPGSERTDSFHLAPGVAVYGGFVGNETERDERDWVANPTILSGDIGTPNDASDNSYHVVYADGTAGIVISPTTILDGFMITGGYAVASSPHDYGGGLFCNGTGSGNECSPTLANIIFSDNLAISGGGLHNRGLDHGISSPNLTNIIFSNNVAIEGGGAMDNLGYLNGNSSPNLTNVIFISNSADFGGAINNFGGNGGNNNLSLTNVTFFNNSANLYGGAIYNDSSISNLANVILWGGSASFGDEIYNDDADLTISHSLIQDGINGIVNEGSSSVTDGGNNLESDPWFVDVTNGDLHLQIDSPAIDAGDNNAPGLNGINTDLDGNPRFVDGNGDNTATVDIGAYENQTTPTCPATTTLFVNLSATGDSSGDDWLNAQPNLAAALTQAAACNVNEIWVAVGTYLPGSERTDSFNLVPGVGVYGGFAGNETERDERDWEANPTILSGDIGTPNDNNDNSYHVVYADGATGTVITNTTILDGFTITAGNADGSIPNDRGGGFYCNGAGDNNKCNPFLTNITLYSNSAYTNGGAMYNLGIDGGQSSPSLTNVSFFDNIADDGGAIYNNGDNGHSSPIVTKVSFFDNNANSFGGAISNSGLFGNSSPVLQDVTFSNNSAISSGGAIFSTAQFGHSSPSLTNVTFFGNMAEHGGAIYNGGGTAYSNPSLTNVTFVSNIASIRGGAIVNVGINGSGVVSLTNVILWENNAPNGSEIINLGATLAISYSVIQDGIAGIVNESNSIVIDDGNNLDIDPLFVNAVNGDLHLQVGSPAIDAGDDGVCPAEDLDGLQRPLAGACDMGAYEFWGLAITAVSPTDAALNWQAANLSCTYDIFESSEPYFTPTTPTYLNVISTHPLNGRLGDPMTNYFFINRATCDGGMTVYSNAVGEFDFALVPGS